jgi:hypothetical protein
MLSDTLLVNISREAGEFVDYLFEQLNAESFQHLCQALLVRDYPDLQCFPVGQPDGGRDATSRAGDQTSLVVGQVKFKREDTSETADWMITALEGELPKVQKLVDEKRAKRYIMMTNARSTAHLDSGKVDRVQKWLDENMPVPAQVLWRRDLDARLDNANDLRLAYPSILTGEAALSIIVEAQLGPNRAKLSGIVKSFLSDQYRRDEEVKFRQVDLADSLLSLFVDVPADLSLLMYESRRDYRLSRERRLVVSRLVARSRFAREPVDFDEFELYGEEIRLGTADFLLSPEVQKEMPWVMLYGAPGQGKSTLAQYVCQVHRARYLNRVKFVGELPPAHVESSFRLPFKVDLRDVASFFDGQAFLGHAAEDMESERTFERFLAHLVSIQAGAVVFTVSDLREVLSQTPALIFLDGLDEVADLGLRELLVERIVAGLHRLREIGANLQVVLTTRPSQLGRAPIFSKEFVRVTLAPISESTVRTYAEKWTRAKRLEEDRRSEVLTILSEKLELTHIRELTKNPMQLAILLSLILSIGHSLPDVRTDLYAKYVDLFMTREAEKDALVRRHQGLLLEIVEFLAWQLQNNAESGRTSGSLSAEALRDLVRAFLANGDHDASILEDLFDRGLERVYVLVQRIEGFYEFEVQPLREYFAAKYLYSTAPVASFRSEHVQGDRAQRFEAIASSPYWANVTRFYAGFYQGGEIGALSTSLKEMISSKDLPAALNARAIGILLLADRTFAGKKPVQVDVVDTIFDQLGVYLSTSTRASEALALPADSGRAQFSMKVFEEHLKSDPRAASAALTFLIMRNGGGQMSAVFQEWIRDAADIERTQRLRLSSWSVALPSVPTSELETLLRQDHPSDEQRRKRLQILVRDDAFSQSESLGEEALADILAWGGYAIGTPGSEISWVANAFSRRAVESREGGEIVDFPRILCTESHAKIASARREIDDFRKETRLSYVTDATYWAQHIEALRSTFGESWAAYRFAVSIVGDISHAQPLPDMVDAADSLVYQALSARRKRRANTYWVERIESTAGSEHLFWLGLFLAWAPSKQISDLLDLVGVALDALSQDDYWRLNGVLVLADRSRGHAGGSKRNKVDASNRNSARLTYALVASFGLEPGDPSPALSEQHLPVNEVINQHKLSLEFDQFPGWSTVKPRSDSRWLALFSQMKKAGADPRVFLYRDPRNPHGVPMRIAKKVLADPAAYPEFLVEISIARMQEEYKPVHVRDIAEGEGWVFS